MRWRMPVGFKHLVQSVLPLAINTRKYAIAKPSYKMMEISSNVYWYQHAQCFTIKNWGLHSLQCTILWLDGIEDCYLQGSTTPQHKYMYTVTGLSYEYEPPEPSFTFNMCIKFLFTHIYVGYKKYRISHGLWLNMIFTFWVVSFVSRSLGKGTENTLIWIKVISHHKLWQIPFIMLYNIIFIFLLFNCIAFWTNCMYGSHQI